MKIPMLKCLILDQKDVKDMEEMEFYQTGIREIKRLKLNCFSKMVTTTVTSSKKIEHNKPYTDWAARSQQPVFPLKVKTQS